MGGGWQGAHHVPSLSAPQAFLPPYSSPHSNIWGASFLQGDFSTSLLRNPNVTRQISSRLEKGEASSPHESHWAERERQCTVVQRWRETGVQGSRVVVRLAGRGMKDWECSAVSSHVIQEAIECCLKADLDFKNHSGNSQTTTERFLS